MGTEQLPEVVGRQDPRVVHGDGLLVTHQHAFDNRSGEHDESDHDIHDADFFVIYTGQPVEPQCFPPSVVGEQRRHDDHAYHQNAAGGPVDKLAHYRVFEGLHKRNILGS